MKNDLHRLIEDASSKVPHMIVGVTQLLRHRSGHLQIIPKGKHRRDGYTEMDTRVEGLLRDELKRRYSDVGFLSEEFTSGYPDCETFWVIDPIDGTGNCAVGYPHFSTSLALIHEGKAVFGCTFDPSRSEMFTVVQGTGTFADGRKVDRLVRRPLADVLVCAGLGVDKTLADFAWCAIGELRQRARGIRLAGCASLDLAYVAAGRCGVFFHPYLKMWDRAAGELMIAEAGGVTERIPSLATSSTEALVGGHAALVSDVRAAIDEALTRR